MTSTADVSATPNGAAFERLVDALHEADCNPRVRGNTKVDARCPAHEDGSPSFSADWHAELRSGSSGVLVHCHAGCDPADIADALGFVYPNDFFDTPVYRQQGTSSPSPKRRAKPAAKKPKRENPPTPGAHLGEPVAVYTYVDESGEIIGEVQRYEHGAGGTELPERRGKTFRWKRPGARGGMVWGAPSRRPLYHLPAVLAAARADETVYLVEGEKDVEALEAAGVVATCNPGGAGKWQPEHTMALEGTHVVIVADRDPQGRTHAAKIADALENTVASVRVVEPAVRDEHADATNHLEAGYTVEEFVDAVLPSPASEPAPSPNDAGGDDGPGATVHQLDVARRSRESGDDDERHGGGSGGGGGSLPKLGVLRDEYAVVDGSLCKVEHDKKGRPYAKELLNGVVRLKQRVRQDMGDGAPVRVSHVDLDAYKGDDVSGEITNIEWPEFEKVSWSADLPWSDVVYTRTATGRSGLVNAILQTSGDVPVITSYGTLGWRQDEETGRWFYVHAGGAIDADGPVPEVRTDIDVNLSEYVLPDRPTQTSELRECLQASLSLMERLPGRVAAPLLGAAYRSVLGECNSTVFLVGRQYTFKSTLAALTLSHLMPTAKHNRLSVGAGEDAATASALEEVRYIAGHTVLAADDLAPDRGAERAAQRANQLGRSQYNRIGKARQDRKGGMRPTHKPRGLLVLTGEDGASSESAATRMMHIPLAPGDVDRDAAIEMSSRRLGYQRARWTAAMISHYADRMPLDEWLVDTESCLTGQMFDRTAPEPGLESRTAELLAALATGWRAALDAAVDLEALSSEEAEEMWARAWAGLQEAKEAQASMVSGQDVITRTSELLRTALSSGAAHVRARDTNGQPEQATQLWGWEAPPVSAEGMDARAKGDMIGWLDGDQVLLDKHAAFAAAERQGRASSEPLGITAKSLADALVGAGIAAGMQERGQRRNYVRRRAAGALREVWEVPVTWLYPREESDQDQPDETPTPDDPDQTPPTLGPAPVQPPQGNPKATEKPTEATTGAAPTNPHHGDKNTPQGNSAPRKSERKSRASWGDREHDLFAVVVGEDVTAAVGRQSSVQDVTRLVDAPPMDAGLAGLLEWAADLGMGWTYKYRPPEDGQIWITPAAAEHLGLGPVPQERRGELSDEERAFADDEAPAEDHEDHPLLRQLEDAGWKVSKAGINPSGWITTWKDSGRTLRIAVIGWQMQNHQTACPLVDEENLEDTYFLAYRLGEFAKKVGMPWHISGGVTGVDLMDAQRPKGSRQGLKESVTPPEPAKKHTLEEDIVWWTRKPERWEAEKRYGHLIDKNAMHLAPPGSLSLGTAGWVHKEAPVFDPKLPAYWRVPTSELVWEDQLWPDPFNPNQREQEDSVWLTTPVLALAARDLEREIRPLEAYVYPDHSRCLEAWKEHLRKVREPLVGNEDPDDQMVLDALKRLYTGATGKLGAESMLGTPRYRPDHRHQIISAARANLMRDLIKVRAADPWLNPLAVATDALVFVSDESDPQKAVPLNFGVKLGQYKAVGTVEFSEIQKFFYMTRSEMRQRRRSGEPGLIETMKGRAV